MTEQRVVEKESERKRERKRGGRARQGAPDSPLRVQLARPVAAAWTSWPCIIL